MVGGRMAQENDLEALSLSGIAHRCAKETELFFARLHHDPLPCFELFRRAFAGGCDRAWDLVYVQYHAQVARWVQRQPSFPVCGEEVSYLVNRAFEKMWAAVTPEKFSHFADLKSVLRYLQMCAYSVVVDAVRKAGPQAKDVEEELLPAMRAQAGRTAGDQALTQVHRREFWEAISARLNDEQERCVVYGSYILGLKPREILDTYPRAFHDVRDIYRVKENVLARLRRDQALHTFLLVDA